MPVFTVPQFSFGWVIVIVAVIAVSVIYEILRNRNNDIDNIEEDLEDRVILKILVPHANTSTPQQAAEMFSSLHGVLGKRRQSYVHMSFEIYATSFGIQFCIVGPRRYKTFIESQIYAHYPFAEISEVSDYVTGISTSNAVGITTMVAVGELEKDSVYPLKTFVDIQTDSMATLTACMSNVEEFGVVGVQVLIRPIDADWQRIGAEYVRNLQQGGSAKKGKDILKDFVGVLSKIYDGIFSIRHLKIKGIPDATSSSQDEIAAIEKKCSQEGFAVKLRILSSAKGKAAASQRLQNCINVFSQFGSYHLNNLTFHTSNDTSLPRMLTAYKTRSLELETEDILGVDEIATLYHFPNATVSTNAIDWLKAKRAEPPVGLPSTGTLIIGKTNFRDFSKEFGIKKEDRLKHMYILGKTGSGKSTLLKNMIIQDIYNGEGVGVIDPHGDLVEELLDYIPQERLKDVVLVDPSDREFPISINIFDNPDPRQQEYIALSILEVFKKYFDSWGPRLEYVLHNTILSLMYMPGSTMLGIERMLTDEAYRKTVLSYVHDPLLHRFWYEEFEYMGRHSRLMIETIAPIQNKVGRFLSSTTIRNIVGQKNSSINFDDILENKKILLCNLSEGKLGEECASLLGSLIVTKLEACVMARAAQLESHRKDFYLYVDEFQIFATSSFMKILSEARKYHCGLIVAHQYISQLQDEVKNAVFGNVGTMISFILGSADAQVLEKEFLPVFSATDLISLEKFHIYLKEVIDGVISKPFSADTLPFTRTKTHSRAEIVARTRNMLAKPRVEIENDIRIWSMYAYQTPKVDTPKPLDSMLDPGLSTR
jgi:hypothetical protein